MHPWPGCQTTLRGDVLKVWKVEPSKEQPRKGDPGEVLTAEGGGLIIQTGEGAVRILELQLPGGKRMAAAEFMRGHSIEQGTVLGG
jgi:methionyl-tRNA formyltransferase